MMRFICLWVFVFCISGYAFCGNPDREFERAMINGAKVSIGIRVTVLAFLLSDFTPAIAGAS